MLPTDAAQITQLHKVLVTKCRADMLDKMKDFATSGQACIIAWGGGVCAGGCP